MSDEHRALAAVGDKSLLNEPQLRHFEVFLSMFETALNEIERLASPASAPPKESLVVLDSDLPGDFKTRAEPLIGVLRQEIGSLAHSLGIDPQHRSRARTVRALLTAELVRLDDSYARKLRGYGVVRPRVQVEVDPVLDRMRGELVALLRVSERDARDATPKSRQ